MKKRGDGLQRNSGWLMLYRCFLMVSLICIFAWIWYLQYAAHVYIPFFRMGNYLVIVLYGILLINYENTYNALDIEFERVSNLIFSHFLSIFLCNLIAYLVIALLIRDLPHLTPLAVCGILQFTFASIWCKCGKNRYLRVVPLKNTVIVYDGDEQLSRLMTSFRKQDVFEIEESFNKDEFLQMLRKQVLPEIETVFLVNVPSSDRNEILKYCIEKRINVYTKPKIGDALMNSASDKYLFHLPFLCVNGCNVKTSYLFVKRLCDFVLALVALCVLSPLLIVISIVIKVSDGGPVFYKQTRLTKDGKEFEILKFRSMRVDAEKNGVAILSTGDNDNRITPVGHFIRSA